MRKLGKWKKQCFILTLCLFLITIFCYNNILIVNYSKIDSDGNVKIGIIDGALYKEHKIITEAYMNSHIKQVSHGDMILDFLEKVSNVEVYYYDATNEEGKIDSENIIKGLEWMKKQDVDYINMSISSKKTSVEIVRWLELNTNIKVFCSYNNIIQSADYPAMYDDVIGSGINEQVMNEDMDKIYRTHNILLIRDLSYYKGNSYLSILTMLDYIKENCVETK